MNRRAYGLRAWLWQRLSSIYMALYLAATGVYFLFQSPGSHEEWRAWMSHPMVALATAVFFWALLIHAWVGARDVLLDYVDPLPLRLALLCVLGLMLIGSGVWLLKILYSLFMVG